MKNYSPSPRPHASEAAQEPVAAPAPGERSVVLACEMIEDEVNHALDRALPAQTHDRPAVVWIESGLHEVPRRLRDHLQDLIEALDRARERDTTAALPSVRPGKGPARERATSVEVGPVDQILLALGYCGNGLEGLVSRHAQLVFPRVDDCISLFLNHGCVREDIERDARAFYLTGGWLSHDNPVHKSHECLRARFGPARAAELTRASMAAYRRITLIDTGAYEIADFKPQSESFAADLKLDHSQVRGSVQLLERLFAGPWDSEIVVTAPGEAISIWHLFHNEGRH